MSEQIQRTDLSDLVRDRRAELKVGLRTLADRCADPETGEQLKVGWLHRLETREPVIPPQLPGLRALAAGLELPLPIVQEAAGAQFMGIVSEVWSEDEDARALVAYLGEMSEAERRQVKAMVEAFARSRSNG
ncbi:XRE family transcriptional regulator [Streptomyces sp. NPDC057743]|uniref:XRE family transcriptional regulator n=1 Tax=Streptomyces sp. NPDC057743 TaxID=3346236 RepID=UPI0036A5A198